MWQGAASLWSKVFLRQVCWGRGVSVCAHTCVPQLPPGADRETKASQSLSSGVQCSHPYFTHPLAHPQIRVHTSNLPGMFSHGLNPVAHQCKVCMCMHIKHPATAQILTPWLSSWSGCDKQSSGPFSGRVGGSCGRHKTQCSWQV